MLARPKEVSERSKPAAKAVPGAWRDVQLREQGGRAGPGHKGKQYLVVIGIDRYRSQPKLNNAVSDARGAQEAFANLGFETKMKLFDEQATGKALESLVRVDLKSLHSEDSLVLFFAGHGHTEVSSYGHATSKVGYLMPVDADDSQMSWIRLDNWLRELTGLPPRHILVILDACHSGIALDTQDRWRAGVRQLPEPLARLRARRSRRIITSALDGQFAADSGPREGHSLFTGCLIEALSGEVGRETGFMTGSAIGVHIQQRVVAFPNSRQTPDIGALYTDDRGELVVALPWGPDAKPISSSDIVQPPPVVGRDVYRPPPLVAPPSERKSPKGAKRKEARAGAPVSPPLPPPSPIPPGHVLVSPPDPPQPKPASALRLGAGTIDEDFAAAMDRHAVQRQGKSLVLSLIAGEPQTVLAEAATWSAQRGQLTLVTQASRLDVAVRDLLAYMPWLRCLPKARELLARAARIPKEAIDAALDARSVRERNDWIERLSAGNTAVHVSGWLLSMLRHKESLAPDLTSAPAQERSLLAMVGELMAPIAVLLHHDEPTEGWLFGALSTAALIARCLPLHTVGIAAPAALVERVLSSRDSDVISMARQGLVRFEPPISADHRRGPAGKSPLATNAQAIEQALFKALERDPRTRGAHFEHRVQAPVYERERTVEVALAARSSRLIVQLDSWYHLRDPKAYQRERLEDVWLTRAGFFVMRFLAEDVERRLGQVVDEIALGLVGRR